MGFLCATCMITVLIIAYVVSNPKTGIFPNMKMRPKQDNNYVAMKFFTSKLERDDVLMKESPNGLLQTTPKIAGGKDLHLDVTPQVATHDGANGYIITQTFGGQMTRAIRNMMLQQCWGASLGYTSYIVEPFSSRSNLYHSSSFWTEADKGKLYDAARFSEYYDLQHYNLKSQKDKSLTLVTWENFLENAPRNSIVLVIPQQSCTLGLREDTPNEKLLSKCSFTKAFQDFITGLKKYNFHVVKVVCVHCNRLHLSLIHI